MSIKYRPHHQKVRTCLSMTQNEFEELSRKRTPDWNLIWNFLLKESKQLRCKGHRSSAAPSELQRKIRNKISALVKKEEILVDLYKKAAEGAKQKEVEFKAKIAILMQQIEKDKTMLRMFKPETYSSCQF